MALLSNSNPAQAQNSDDDKRTKWYFGGNIGVQFGTVTLIDISPMAGYPLTERLSSGIGATYKYYHIKNYAYNIYTNRYQSLSSHIVGSQVFMRYFLFRQFFAHTEYEYLRFRNMTYRQNPATQSYDKEYVIEHVNSVFIGTGYRQHVGPRSAFDILLLYNLNETPSTPYNNPLIRMGFVFGI
ncbi:MAG: hypothetical protein U1C46_05960 [Bacteroidales bacterium]|nr:hypothetical protein [Bacteroidales bacterium]